MCWCKSVCVGCRKCACAESCVRKPLHLSTFTYGLRNVSRTSRRSVPTSEDPEEVGTRQTAPWESRRLVLGGVVLRLGCGGSAGPASVLQAAPEAPLLLPSGSGSPSAETGSGFTTVEVEHSLVYACERGRWGQSQACVCVCVFMGCRGCL